MFHVQDLINLNVTIHSADSSYYVKDGDNTYYIINIIININMHNEYYTTITLNVNDILTIIQFFENMDVNTVLKPVREYTLLDDTIYNALDMEYIHGNDIRWPDKVIEYYVIKSTFNGVHSRQTKSHIRQKYDEKLNELFHHGKYIDVPK